MPLPPGAVPGPAIGEDKIAGYLLNINHAEGWPKARFFLSRGFTLDDPRPFISALLDHAHLNNLVKTTQNEFGTRFVCEGPLATPDGVNPRVRSVWQWKTDEHFRLLVTAYPF